ncbi:hypothetical protein [Bosea sp. MMO-172]|uniref:hypothetical protein n=1 Tax=Bosea sp. MMO-172 TaxID=3127885 RepID=UPI00301629D9
MKSMIDGEMVIIPAEQVAAFTELWATPSVVPIPNITRRQLRLWLVRQGIALADVEAAIGSLPAPVRAEAQIEWADASAYERSNPLIGSIGAAIGLSPEQIDDGFRDAATY